MADGLPEFIDPNLERRWAAIRGRMEANADWLRDQGSLTAKVAFNRRRWVLRFKAVEGGRRVQRSIYIASDDQAELCDRTRRLLDHYRQQGRWPAEVAVYARLAQAAGGIARRLASGRARARRKVGGRAGP